MSVHEIVLDVLLAIALGVLGALALAGTVWVGYWTRRLDRQRAGPVS